VIDATGLTSTRELRKGAADRAEEATMWEWLGRGRGVGGNECCLCVEKGKRRKHIETYHKGAIFLGNWSTAGVQKGGGNISGKKHRKGNPLKGKGTPQKGKGDKVWDEDDPRRLKKQITFLGDGERPKGEEITPGQGGDGDVWARIHRPLGYREGSISFKTNHTKKGR